jgi:hypothetical protein
MSNCFWRTLSVSQWYRMSIAFDRFCLIVSLTMPYAVELSVRRGVGGCVCPSLMSVNLRGAPNELHFFFKSVDASLTRVCSLGLKPLTVSS